MKILGDQQEKKENKNNLRTLTQEARKSNKT